MPAQFSSTGVKTAVSAALTLPATAAGTIFTVTGHVWVLSLYALVTTVVQAQATTIKWSAKVGALSAVDVSNATADLNGMTVGTIVMPITTFGTTAVNNANGVLISVPITAPPISFMMSGSGIITITTGATSTGALEHHCAYVPMSAGALIA